MNAMPPHPFFSFFFLLVLCGFVSILNISLSQMEIFQQKMQVAGFLLALHKRMTHVPSQQLVTYLHGSCVQRCKLHKLRGNYCREVSYTCFHTQRITHSHKNQNILCSCRKNSLWASAVASVHCTSPTVESTVMSTDATCCKKVKQNAQWKCVPGPRSYWQEWNKKKYTQSNFSANLWSSVLKIDN